MPLVTNEQSIKRPSLFLKIEDGCKVILKSNLYKIVTHYLKKKNSSVLCLGDKCHFCSDKNPPRQEYYYYGLINGEKGLIRVPPSCFYDMNKAEKLLKKTKRNFEWIISKEGSGKKTRYSVVRGEDIKVNKEEIEENNKKLTELMQKQEGTLRAKHDQFMADDVLDEQEGIKKSDGKD